MTTIKRFMITDQLVQKLTEKNRHMEVTVLTCISLHFCKNQISLYNCILINKKGDVEITQTNHFYVLIHNMFRPRYAIIR
jgi:hypothetical protein